MSKLKLSDLTPDDKNYNKGSEFGNSLIEKSLRKFGAGRSILLDKNNRIIAGNKTIENAGAVGLEDIIVVETTGNQIVAVKRTDIDLDSKIGRELALADNASAKASITWDFETIKVDWQEIEMQEWGIEIPDFEVLEAEEDDFAAPEGGTETDIVLGDLFEIGEHRLLCGDSTDSDQVAKLMNGQNILNISVLTDPPYGIKWNGDYTRFKKNGIADSKTKYEDIKNDDVEFNPSQFYEYQDVIIWGANIFSNKLDRGSWLIWDKRSNDGTSFLADAEIAWQKGDKYGCYIKSINQQSEKSKTRDIKHPTKKPIELMIWCIERLKENNIIFDAYLGSGSTMVASHQLKRKCYGMELDPKYCQVIVDRMKKLDPSLVIKKNGVTL